MTPTSQEEGEPGRSAEPGRSGEPAHSRQPGLSTDRLLLRPFAHHDAGAVQRLADHPEVSATSLHIPRGGGEGLAEAWIQELSAGWREGRLAVFAAVLPDTGDICGAAGLTIDRAARSAELGFWFGRPFWGRGYGYEAAKALVEWGFNVLDLRRIHASHLDGNDRSRGILEKLGMQHEGTLREHTLHRGEWCDVHLWGILTTEWGVAGSSGETGEVPPES
jgi:[ribosomal protein S5]-alanine N-acetyltransferase